MQAMTEKDLPTLIAEQRQLILEKSVILDLLRKVRDEMHKLQVEQLQLDSMIMTENGLLTEKGSRERDISGSTPAETTDMDSKNVNEEELDLSVSSALNKMLHGQYFAEQQEEEEEDEEEEEEEENYTQDGLDEDEFILPL